MKTSELLRLYRDGRRDFSGINLRGADLAGQDLSGANFSDCQIQGANFEGANLTGAKFIRARSGLQKRWLILSGSLFLSVNFLYSFVSAYFGYLVYVALKYRGEIAINFLSIPLILFWIFLYHNTLKKNRISLVFVVEAITVSFLAIGTIKLDTFDEINISVVSFNIVAIGLSFSLLSPIGGTLFGILYVAGILPFLYSAIPPDRSEMLADFYLKIWMLISTLWFNAFAYFIGLYILKKESDTVGVKRARNFLLALISIQGTSFYGADLRDTDFTDANIKSTDFQRAILTGTCWNNTRNVNLARFDRSVSVK